MSEQHNGDPERVVVRDRRRIDPVTGEARVTGGEESPPGTAEAPSAVDDDAAAQLAERTADLQRVTAEYANYRRRVDRDREAVVASAKAHVVSDLLPVLDDLERAAAHGDLVGAFKAVADKFVATLSKLGVEPFGAEGEAFDPAVHEAVHHDTSLEVAGPTVAAVLRRGYRLNDRLLRPAMVAVTDRPTGEDAAQPEQPLPSAAEPFVPGSARREQGRSEQGGPEQGTAEQGGAEQGAAEHD